MKTLALLGFFSSFSALAHLEVGTYKGVTPEGAECFVQIENVFFLNNLKHPLSERAAVKFNNVIYTIQHPSVIDEQNLKVRFSHDYFETVVPFAGGAEYIKMTMSHDAESEGPSSFTTIKDNWKTNTSSKSACLSLQFQN